MFTLSPAIDRYNAIQGALNQQQGDPIGNGAMKGMDAAKSSLSLSPPQMNRATPMARGISSLMGNMQTPQPGTGSAGMLQSIAQAMGPAMQSYYNAQDTDAAIQMKQQEAMQQQEQDLLKMALSQQTRNAQNDYHNRHLAETSRHNQAMEQLGGGQRQQGLMGVPETGIEALDSLPVLDKKSKTDTLKKINASSTLLSEVNNIERKLAEFEALTEGSTFDPFGPGSSITNKVKDAAGYFGGNEQLDKERTLRKQLDSSLRQFNITLERNLKGGVVSEGMAKRFENKEVLPGVNEPLPDLKAKLNDLKHHIEIENKSAKLSAKYGRNVDPVTYEEMIQMHSDKPEAKATPQAQSDDPQKAALMQRREALMREREALLSGGTQ